MTAFTQLAQAARLLPCPFCDAQGRETTETDFDYPAKKFMFIQCTRCGARTSNVYGSGDPSEWADARHNWNTRAALAAAQAVAEPEPLIGEPATWVAIAKARKLGEGQDLAAYRSAVHHVGQAVLADLSWQGAAPLDIRISKNLTPTQPLPTAAAIEQAPEGFVMVPKEPTRDMLIAGAGTPGMKAIDNSCVTMQLRGHPLASEAFKDGAPLAQAWRAMLAATPTHPAPVPLCACKDRPASECDEEWGPNCDLGNNPAHVRVVSPEKSAEVDAILGIQRAAPVLANGLTEAETAASMSVQGLSRPTKDAGDMPPLPETSWHPHAWERAFSADQMHAYALAARTSPAAPSQEARDDAALLDWIERHVCDVSRLGDSARTLRISWNNGADSAFVGPLYHASWRQAIRATMAATTSTPGEQA